MINITEIQAQCSRVLGFNLAEIEQGSPEWHRSRAGVISASKAVLFTIDDALAPFPEGVEINKVGKDNFVDYNGKSFSSTRKSDCVDWVRQQLPRVQSDGKLTYMDELVASIATGLIPDEVTAKTLQWGKDHEEGARDAFSAATFECVNEASFIYQNSSMRVGVSPDGLIDGKNKGLELKCPFSSGVWVGFAGRNKIKQSEMAQVQFTLWVTGAESWYFAKFDPRNINCKKLHYVEVPRDEEMIAKIEANVSAFILQMDESLKNLGMEFGQQWTYDLENDLES